MTFPRCSVLVLQLCCLGAVVSFQSQDGLSLQTPIGRLEISPEGVKINKPQTPTPTGPGSSSRSQEPVYYIQRDGNTMMRRGTQTSRLSSPVPGGNARDNVIETNALLQHMPSGVSLGEISPEMTETQYQAAYPHNPVVAESPKVFHSPRPELSVDQVIKSVNPNQNPHQLHYASNSSEILMELDMRMSYAQYMHYYENRRLVPRRGRRMKRKALRSEFTHWPNAIIPFTVDDTFTVEEKRLLYASLKAWMEHTCIQFIPARPSDKDVLRIQNGQGCNSFVGRVGGKQHLNLEKGCRVKHVMTHELGHVIGLIHEHQRPDRDNYITVASENVGVGRMKNYRKFDINRIRLYGVNYDYTSIMHYGKTAFSKDDYSTTMITTDPAFQDIIGTTTKVSFKDAKIVNSMYKCDSKCRRKPNCGDGYVDKNCRCVCPGFTQRCGQRRWRTVTPVPRNIQYPRYPSYSNTGWARRYRPQYEQRVFPSNNIGFGQYYPSVPYYTPHHGAYYPQFK
ncbi:zinc metalloproteinase nas-36-like [Haliotis asinina]|uniref:zinc metalloproteinase nas-36-like n=1 Tax=Haliotis asinina TaxID=109174 RepID=UPI003532067F